MPRRHNHQEEEYGRLNLEALRHEVRRIRAVKKLDDHLRNKVDKYCGVG